MKTKRQQELEHAARQILGELGPNTSTEFLIAVTSERTKVEPDEIVEAISAVNRGGNGAATASLACDAPADPRKSHSR
jgi:hypothetical protein